MRRGWFALPLFVIALAGPLGGQAPLYQTPPRAIVDILDAAPLPDVYVGPACEVLALVPRTAMPSIAELARPMLRLAGTRVNPANNGPHRAPSGTGITLGTLATGAERTLRYRLAHTSLSSAPRPTWR